MADKDVEVCFQFNKDTRAMVERMDERHEAMVERIDTRHDTAMLEIRKDIKDIVDKVINRLPPWVLIYTSFLTLLVGGLLAKVAF